MSASLQIVFLDSDYIGHPRSLEDVLQTFIGAGFAIEELQVGRRTINKEEYAQQVSDMLALAYNLMELSFRAFHPTWHLELYQQVGWGLPNLGGEKRAWVRTSTDNTPYFWRPEYNPELYSRRFLDLGKRLYSVVHPSFGWIDFDYGLLTTHQDIEALRLPVLYWANFFGPSYTAKIGRGKIAAAPNWRVEELLDGGLLYLIASSPGLASQTIPSEQVQAYFGVERVR